MVRFLSGRLQKWLLFLVCMLVVLRTESLYANITYVHSAVAKGAVCLDGSPPAYHFDKGYGTGINNWLVHVEGGGWCNNVTSCLARKTSRLGSSTRMFKQLAFSGILSNRGQFNPDFYNWNRVKIGYCDGGSFTGDVEEVNPATKLYYRGARIFPAVIDDLLEKGMRNAKNAILSGCSAGGLTSILHCDTFKNLLSRSTKVKCLSDAGYFINSKDVSGAQHIEDYFNDVVRTHGSAKNLPRSCTSRMKPSLCFFPQYVAEGIKIPLFIVNSAIDSWQIRNILAPGDADPHGLWSKCKFDITKCSATELQRIQGYRSEFINALSRLGASTSRGYFINSCFAHCQTEQQEYWFGSDTPMLNDKTIARAVGDWFYDRSPFQKIDCGYSCDKTCHNQVLGGQDRLSCGAVLSFGLVHFAYTIWTLHNLDSWLSSSL